MKKGDSESSNRVSRKYVIERRIWGFLAFISLVCIFIFRNSEWGLRAASAVEIITLFFLGDKIFQVRFMKRHYAFLIILIIAGFLGSPLYFIYPNYDKILHLIGPMLVCSIVLFMIKKLHLEMKWKIMFAFFATFALLGTFELGEYTIDKLFDFKLQGVYLRDAYGLDKLNVVTDKIDDTMLDLFFGMLGIAIYCAFVSWIYKKRTHKHLLNYP